MKPPVLFTSIAVMVMAVADVGCSRWGGTQREQPQKVVIDLYKFEGVNVCPDRTPRVPHANVDLSILMPAETSPGRYQVVVYRATAESSAGTSAEGDLTVEGGDSLIRVRLALETLPPGLYTLGISTKPKVSYCDIRVE